MHLLNWKNVEIDTGKAVLRWIVLPLLHIETVVCLGKKKSNDYVEIGVDAEDYYRIKDSGKDRK